MNTKLVLVFHRAKQLGLEHGKTNIKGYVHLLRTPPPLAGYEHDHRFKGFLLTLPLRLCKYSELKVDSRLVLHHECIICFTGNTKLYVHCILYMFKQLTCARLRLNFLFLQNRKLSVIICKLYN